MHMPSLPRTLTAVAVGAATSFVLVSMPAAAQATIPINPGNVPATAADYEHECSEQLGGGPYPGKDVWVFNLPGKADKTGSFTAIAAVFDTDGDGKGDTTVQIDAGAADGDDIVTVGHSKAYAITDAGWTLVGATATITGEADKFVLTHTCAAAGTKPPTTAPTGSPSGSPSATTSVEASTPSSTVSVAGGKNTGGGSAGSGSLPITGGNAGGAAALGLLLIGGGAALVLRRRRRFMA